MEFGAAIFFTDYSIGPAALGRALEERGFGDVLARLPEFRKLAVEAGRDPAALMR